jgi:hypothetical protein
VRGTPGLSVRKKGWKDIASTVKRRPLEWSLKNTMGIRKQETASRRKDLSHTYKCIHVLKLYQDYT